MLHQIDSTMYRQMIGSLIYLTNMRPDICFVVNTLSQYLTNPRHVHLTATKHILRYLKGTVDYGLKYDANQKINLEGYVDSDWEGSAINRKSTSGCCFSMGSSVIEIKYHYIRDMVQKGAVKLQYAATDEQIANVLTNPLAKVKFEYFKESWCSPY